MFNIKLGIEPGHKQTFVKKVGTCHLNSINSCGQVFGCSVGVALAACVWLAVITNCLGLGPMCM
jgi:hypothetical protein